MCPWYQGPVSDSWSHSAILWVGGCSRYYEYGNRWVLPVIGGLVFPHSPLGRDVSESPLAKIGEVVNIVVPFVIAVSATCRHVMGVF